MCLHLPTAPSGRVSARSRSIRFGRVSVNGNAVGCIRRVSRSVSAATRIMVCELVIVRGLVRDPPVLMLSPRLC